MQAPYKVYAFLKDNFPVSQYYGNNPTYYAQFGLAGHEGVDIATPNGTEIYSPLDGIVVRDVVNDREYGNAVVIWDPVQKCALWFCHLQDVLVNPSDTVHAGQLVGHTNNTGNTTGPHVHVNFVETDENGYRLNLDNGYQGFLNLLDTSLVDILPFPGLQASDPQMPKPTDTTSDQPPIVNSQDAEAQPEAPATPEAPAETLPAQPAEASAPSTTSTDPKDQQIADLTAKLEQATQQNVDLTTKLKTVMDKYTTDLGNYQVMQAAGYSSLDDVEKKLEGVTKDNEGLQKQILQTTQSNAALAEQLKAKNSEDSTAIEMGLAAASRVKELESTIQAIAGAHGTKPTLPAILTAVANMQNKIETLLKQLNKKTIKEDIQIAQNALQAVVSPKNGGQGALDFVAGLFFSQGKAVN